MTEKVTVEKVVDDKWPEVPFQILLYDGSWFSPLEPDPKLITIENLSFALARIPRWSGHTYAMYSVAQHSVMVASYVIPSLELPALLHDAHECLSGFGDIPVPVKQRFPRIQEIEQGIDLAVCEAFGTSIDLMYDDDVKKADMRALATEFRDLINTEDMPVLTEKGITPFKERIRPAKEEHARTLFERRLVYALPE